MRHVLWVDSSIIQKYKRGWTPVSHPFELSGRIIEAEKIGKIEKIEKIEKTGEVKRKNKGDRDERDEEGKELGDKKRIGGEREDDSNDVDVKNEGDTDSENEKKKKNAAAQAVDDARKRFLARKNQKK